MSDQQKEESQKTIVSFIVGLLIGGLLVWAFSGEAPKAEEKHEDKNATTTTTQGETIKLNTETTETTPEAPVTESLTIGEAAVSVSGQAAGTSVSLASATFPTAEGWVGVRDFSNGQMGGLLGVARYSQSQGLVPTSIQLQRATKAGNEYAIVFYTESGDRVFSLVSDVQIDAPLMTFTAQ